MNDLVDKIMAYETGEMDQEETIRFFGALVATGQAWSLQGHYGRTAQMLIDQGYLLPSGEVIS